mmetsp:Transcript_63177/g.70639  ORF Transcript_63177/g.70639 Transcript_63177/m.70639 type:complete len:110 (+) Transcript_63177:808-1137(+)
MEIFLTAPYNFDLPKKEWYSFFLSPLRASARPSAGLPFKIGGLLSADSMELSNLSNDCGTTPYLTERNRARQSNHAQVAFSWGILFRVKVIPESAISSSDNFGRIVNQS